MRYYTRLLLVVLIFWLYSICVCVVWFVVLSQCGCWKIDNSGSSAFLLWNILKWLNLWLSVQIVHSVLAFSITETSPLEPILWMKIKFIGADLIITYFFNEMGWCVTVCAHKGKFVVKLWDISFRRMYCSQEKCNHRTVSLAHRDLNETC